MAGHGTAAYPEIFAMGRESGARRQLAADQAAVAIALMEEGLSISRIARVIRRMQAEESYHGWFSRNLERRGG